MVIVNLSVYPDIPHNHQNMEPKTVTTSHVELKRKVLEAATKRQQSVIDDFKQHIQEMLGSAAMINEEEMDLSQQEFNTEMFQRSNYIADQLAFANEEMKLLYNLAATIGNIHNTAQLGTVVVTDRENFFVSVSVEDFEVEGMHFFGLSTESPLFKSMEGKKKGDRFSLNYSEYRIIDIF